MKNTIANSLLWRPPCWSRRFSMTPEIGAPDGGLRVMSIMMMDRALKRS